MKSIITITLNPSVDQSSTTNVVIDEHKLQCNNPRYDPGGGGINVSRVINILGGQTKAFYPAGGCNGDLLEHLLDNEKLDHVRIDVQNLTRINFHIIEESTDRQFRFNMPGKPMTEGEFKDLIEDINDFTPPPDFIVLSGSLPPGMNPDCIREIAEIAEKINAKFIVDSSGEALRKALGKGLYLIKPNLREFSELIGKQISDQYQIIKEAQRIIEQGLVSVIIVSMGQAGTIFVSTEKSGHIQTPFVPINSRIGAGDSMLAAVTLKLALGESLDNAIRYGVAAGSAAVKTPGTELCRKEDVEKLYEKLKEQ